MRLVLCLSSLLAVGLLSACGEKSEQTEAAAETTASPAPGVNDAETAALLATLPAPYNAADLKAGEKAWNKCRSCHTLIDGGIDMVGPNLHGVFGRRSGTKPGYQYSDAMKAHDAVWDYATLDDYLGHPQQTVKGTKMGFLGLKDETERRNLIAYLKVETTPK